MTARFSRAMANRIGATASVVEASAFPGLPQAKQSTSTLPMLAGLIGWRRTSNGCLASAVKTACFVSPLQVLGFSARHVACLIHLLHCLHARLLRRGLCICRCPRPRKVESNSRLSPPLQASRKEGNESPACTILEVVCIASRPFQVPQC